MVGDLQRLRPDIDVQTKAVGARLLYVSDLVQRYYGAVSEKFGVSTSGVGVLVTLARHAPNPLTLSEINQDILVSSAGITFVIGRLEAQRLIRKKIHPSDGRAVLVELTRQGQLVADEIIDAVAQADVAALRQSASHLPQADRLLRHLQAGIESAMAAQLESQDLSPP